MILMAVSEADREDLIREAVALPERAELRVPGFVQLITIGFRVTSAMSVFVGQDPVYQFDPDGRLRRAYVAGLLYRSEHNTLARLQRIRTESQTQLLRHDLDAAELESFHQTMTEVFAAIVAPLKSRVVQVVRAVPPEAVLLPKIEAAFEAIRLADPWLSPQIRRRVIRDNPAS